MSFESLARNVNYVAVVVLFLIGLYAVAARPHPIKKVMGLVIMQSSVLLFFVSLGLVGSGEKRVLAPGFRASRLVNPLPQAFVISAIVVGVAVVALALAIALKMHGSGAHGSSLPPPSREGGL